MELTQKEFALISTSSHAAHDLLWGKIAQELFKLAGETYSPANYTTCENDHFHENDIEFYF